MTDVIANGLRIHVQRLRPGAAAGAGDGRAPVVVFLHGLVLDNLSSFYYTLAAPVARAGADVVLYDQRGHGRSDRPPGGYDIDTAVDDLAGVLRACGVHEPVHLVGNSYGGRIGLHAACRRPELVAGLVLIEGHCVETHVTGGGRAAARGWTEDMANTLNQAAIGLEHNYRASDRPDPSMRRFMKMGATANALLNGTSLIEDVTATPTPTRAELAAVTCPVLGLYGEHSPLCASARELQSLLPHYDLRVFPGMAHTVLREATGEVLRLLTDWLGVPARRVPAPEPVPVVAPAGAASALYEGARS